MYVIILTNSIRWNELVTTLLIVIRHNIFFEKRKMRLLFIIYNVLYGVVLNYETKRNITKRNEIY